MKNKIEIRMPLLEALHESLHRLHDFLSAKLGWYRSWHQNKLAHHLHLAVMFLAVGLTLTGLYFQSALAHSTSVDFELTYERTNQVREEFKKTTLTLDPILTRVAQEKAEDILVRDYFSHQDPGGKLIWGKVASAGYDYLYVGENLAKGFSNMDELVAAWLSSPTHRDNLLSEKYQDLGIGISEGKYQGSDTLIVVELFGVKKTSRPLEN